VTRDIHIIITMIMVMMMIIIIIIIIIEDCMPIKRTSRS